MTVTRIWHGRWFNFAGWVRSLALGASAAVSLLLKADLSGLPTAFKWIADVVAWTKGAAWFLVPSALFLAWAAFLFRKWLGDPAVIQVVHDLLTDYRNKVISDRASGFEHHHRVTLFRHKEWAWVRRCWPWNGWLIPVIRSGQTTRNPSCRFRASSDDPERAEGVAGLAWVSDKDIEITQLPDVSFPNATDEAVAKYAANTGLDAATIRKMRPHARSFYATRVHVQNKLWGVMVIDSKNDTLRRRKIDSEYEAIYPSLSVLLRRI